MGRLKVLYVASEAVPFAKTGGLADVAGSLPVALGELGADVRVMIPKYASVKIRADEATLGKKVKVYFIREDRYFKRKELYGDKFGDYHDNLERFAFFSRACLERCKAEGFSPDIINCNDWMTALVPVYIKTLHKDDPFFANTKVLLTIHNLAYQGLFPRDEYPTIGLGWEYFAIDCFEYYDRVNLMKAGVIHADAVNTVSPTYAKEILEPQFGCGLEGVLKAREDDLYGILNGIDYSVWNPQTDRRIFKKYSVDDLEGKYINKEALQKEVGMKVDRDIPMIGMISRLADQKGLDILSKILDELLNLKVQLIILGTGDNKYHILLEKICARHPRNTSVNLRFDAILAEKIYAGCDMFLMPSRYEPCGLSQMISFRFGTIPIARQTGGLKDSVREFDLRTGEGSGFVFGEYRAEDLFSAVKRALAAYKNSSAWGKLITKVMRLDFSWKKSAKEYLRLYKNMTGVR